MSTKRAQIVKQTCSFQLEVCLSMCDLLVDIRHKMVNNQIWLSIQILIQIRFNFAKFGKMQIFSLFLQSIPKILQFVCKITSRRWSFSPLGKNLYGLSLEGHKPKSIHCIRLHICVLSTHTKVKHWQKFQKNVRWLVTWVGWLEVGLSFEVRFSP